MSAGGRADVAGSRQVGEVVVEGGADVAAAEVPEPSSTPGDCSVEFCGEWFPVPPGRGFVIGREGDLALDDNPYLHRRFLEVTLGEDLWWLTNVGSRLAATVCDTPGGVQAWLPPGGRLPLVFGLTTVIFSAGPTTYELTVHTTRPPFEPAAPRNDAGGVTTVGQVSFTTSQKALVVALCEPLLVRDGGGTSDIPSSAQAAARLGWALTRFNRKLDNVCDKLDRAGVRGLRGGPGRLAVHRRARLVEYAVTSRLVTAADLVLLDRPAVEPQEAPCGSR